MPPREKVDRASSMNYLHEKAEESRHNETLAYLMFMAGAIFFVGGLLETVVTTENPNWFLIFPYKVTPHAYSLLGLSMVLSGFTLLVLGIILGIYYASDRAIYMNQLREAYASRKDRESKRHWIIHGLKPQLTKQQDAEEISKLEECTKYLMEKKGFDELDARSYCELLGDRWRELVESNE